MPSDAAQQLLALGNARFAAGDLKAAADCYRRALQIDPSLAAASFNLACTVDRLAGPGEALPHFVQAAELRPEWCDARCNLALALARVGRMPEAVLELEAAAALDPSNARIRNDLGLALSALGRGEQAFASFRESIRLDPLVPEPHNNLAVLFEQFGRTSEAIAACREALRLRPDYPEAHSNLASALNSQGRHAEAVGHYREALRLRPDYSEARSSLLFCLCYPAGIPERDIFAEHLSFGALQRAKQPEHPNDPFPERPLKIGYVSADFRSHAVARFIEPVLRHHDRSRFRVHCYANVSVPDARSAVIGELCDSFKNIAGMPDAAAEELIRRDGIDILVDLSGHTAGNRLSLFARKPAPIQVTWLGYPNTTGLDAIDYRITDAVADPPGPADALHAEKLLRLPGNFSCFQPDQDAPEVGELPSLREGCITFGSFNNPAKITPETVALWGAALRAVPGSRMLVKGYSFADAGSRRRFAELFAKEGIAVNRLEFVGNTPSYRDHLALYRRIDIALDTFPYNGTTTTCEALWMGVPVLTLTGEAHRSRVGASLLTSVGLEELVAEEPRAFAALAQGLASAPQRLAGLRQRLRPLISSSRLTDAATFTTNLEAAYREIWRRWSATAGAAAAATPPARRMERASVLLQQGALDRALQEYLAVLKGDPGQTSVLGGIEQVLGRQMSADMARALNADLARLGAPQIPPLAEPVLDATLEETAECLLSLGFVTPAELCCRYLLDRGRRSVALSRFLAEIALRVGQPACAAAHLRDAAAAGDASLATRIKLVKAEESARHTRQAPQGERFLLIKAWGYGFWSDVNHVLGQLLVAEITRRTPVVHWGGNSLFSDDPHRDAFQNFFEPVSAGTIDNLIERRGSCYPPKWNRENLRRDVLNQGDGPWSRLSSLHVLERREEVVVSDFHFAVHDLVPWIPQGHHLHGLTTEQVYLYLFRRYLRVQPAIVAQAEEFYRQNMAGRPHLALHIRGGDKGGEDANLARLNSLYAPELERRLLRAPQAGVFLMTDDEEILAGYLERYGDKLVHTGATRTGNQEGVHYQKHPSRARLAQEVIIDSLLACRCDAFIGNGLSNVSCAVAQMKDWAPGALTLFGARLDRLRQITLYRS